MKIKDYREFFDMLDTSAELDERILRAVQQSKSAKRNYGRVKTIKTRAAIVAAVFVIMFIPVSIGAKITRDYYELK